MVERDGGRRQGVCAETVAPRAGAQGLSLGIPEGMHVETRGEQAKTPGSPRGWVMGMRRIPSGMVEVARARPAETSGDACEWIEGWCWMGQGIEGEA